MKKQEIKKILTDITPEISDIEYYKDDGKCFSVGIRVFQKRRKIQASDFEIGGCYNHEKVNSSQFERKNNWDTYDGELTQLTISEGGGSLYQDLNVDLDKLVKDKIKSIKKRGEIRKIYHTLY